MVYRRKKIIRKLLLLLLCGFEDGFCPTLPNGAGSSRLILSSVLS